MAKDEVSRQIEELEKYLKEQKKRERLQDIASGKADEYYAGPDGYYREEETLDYEPVVVEEISKANPAETNRKNASGCFSVIWFFVICGMLFSIFSSNLRPLGNFIKQKVENVKSAAAASSAREKIKGIDLDNLTFEEASNIAEFKGNSELYNLLQNRDGIRAILKEYESIESSFYNFPERFKMIEDASTEEREAYFIDFDQKNSAGIDEFSDEETYYINFYREYSMGKNIEKQLSQEIKYVVSGL